MQPDDHTANARLTYRLAGLPAEGDNDQMTNDSDPAAGEGWLLLVYRVPPEPTRLRAAVWRRLKSLGAVYLQNSVAALPARAESERALRKLRNEIAAMAGSATLLSCQALAGGPEIHEAFQAARNDEYDEIVDRCEDYLAQVQKEHVASHFTYAELEENEVDLAKLRKWFAKVVKRDVFGANGRHAAEESLQACDRSLETYAAKVYATETYGH